MSKVCILLRSPWTELADKGAIILFICYIIFESNKNGVMQKKIIQSHKIGYVQQF